MHGDFYFVLTPRYQFVIVLGCPADAVQQNAAAIQAIGASLRIADR
jgi:hypothetical protein